VFPSLDGLGFDIRDRSVYTHEFLRLGCKACTRVLEVVIFVLEQLFLLQDEFKLRPDRCQVLIDQPDSDQPRVCAVLRRRWLVHALWLLDRPFPRPRRRKYHPNNYSTPPATQIRIGSVVQIDPNDVATGTFDGPYTLTLTESLAKVKYGPRDFASWRERERGHVGDC
jgi:hypothetical protein